MNAYGALARWYDRLTPDVPYERFCALYERIFAETGGVSTVLDLGCGTGTMTALLAGRGYELIAADSSPDMLSEAQRKLEGGDFRYRPLLILQGMEELDLYGTVDAAVSTLDAVNHLRPRDLGEAFRRLHLFIRPGGVLVFDILSPERLRALDGTVSIDETDEVFCVWRSSLRGGRVLYGVDLFERAGESWRREKEEYAEYIHEPEALLSLLRERGFVSAELIDGAPAREPGRLFIKAINGEIAHG